VAELVSCHWAITTAVRPSLVRGGKQNSIIHPAAAAFRSCHQAGSMLPAVTLVVTVFLSLCCTAQAAQTGIVQCTAMHPLQWRERGGLNNSTYT